MSSKSRGRKKDAGTRRCDGASSPGKGRRGQKPSTPQPDPAEALPDDVPGERLCDPALLAEEVMASAKTYLKSGDVLDARLWASAWLGRAWSQASPLDHSADHPAERAFLEEIARRCAKDGSRRALPTLLAFQAVAPAACTAVLDDAIATATPKRSKGSKAKPDRDAGAQWRPSRAWRGTDVWNSVSILFVEIADPVPFTLVAPIDVTLAERVTTLLVMEAGVAEGWTSGRGPDDVPLSVVEHPLPDALAELATALRGTDGMSPLAGDEGYLGNRALAYALCREHVERLSDAVPPREGEPDRDEMLRAFLAETSLGASQPVATAADLCLRFGRHYFPVDPLAWSPGRVEAFLLSYVPHNVPPGTPGAAAIPAVLPEWIRFSLRRRGVPGRWIDPVLDVVDECLPDLEQAMAGEVALAGR